MNKIKFLVKVLLPVIFLSSLPQNHLLAQTTSEVSLSKLYVNEIRGYSINYPLNWRFYEYKNAGGIDFYGPFGTPSENKEMSDLGIKVLELNDSVNFQKYCENFIADLKNAYGYSDAQIHDRKEFVIEGGYNAISFVFRAKSVGTYDSRFMMLIEMGSKVYWLRGLLSPEFPSETKQLYFEIMSTIQFTK